MRGVPAWAALAWVVVDSRRRSVQDVVCRSRVIYDSRAAAVG
jgi:hypothetical protein